MNPEAHKQPTDFERLPDGSLLDLIGGQETTCGLQFVHWREGESRLVHSFEYDGKIFVPPNLDVSLRRAVRFPNNIAKGVEGVELLTRIVAFLKEFLDIDPGSLHLIAVFAMYTWLWDLAQWAPILWITGPPASGKTTLLCMLHCLCRRPVLLTDMTTAGLYSVQKVRPTLLIDECEFGRSADAHRLMGLLRAGTTRGIGVFRQGHVFDCFGPKIIAARLQPEDPALASRSLFINMLPTRRLLRFFNPELLRPQFDDFQSRLLSFRLANYARLGVPELDEASDLCPRMLQIARSLAIPLQNDRSMRQQLIYVLREQHQEQESFRCDTPEYLVAEALFLLAHEQKVGELFVNAIADRLNDNLSERGDERHFKARKVGAILKGSLGIRTERLGRWGRGIVVNNTYLRAIHALARRFRITRRDIASWMAVKAGYGGYPCDLCAEFNLEDGLRFVPHSSPRHHSLFDFPDDPIPQRNSHDKRNSR